MTAQQADMVRTLRYAVEWVDLDVVEEGDMVVASGDGMCIKIAPSGAIGETEGIDAATLATYINMAHSRVQEEKGAEAAAAEAAAPRTLTLPPAGQAATGITALTVEGPGLMPVPVPIAPEGEVAAKLPEEAGWQIIPPTDDGSPKPEGGSEVVVEATDTEVAVEDVPGREPASDVGAAAEADAREEAETPKPPKKPRVRKPRKTAKSGG